MVKKIERKPMNIKEEEEAKRRNMWRKAPERKKTIFLFEAPKRKQTTPLTPYNKKRKTEDKQNRIIINQSKENKENTENKETPLVNNKTTKDGKTSENKAVDTITEEKNNNFIEEEKKKETNKRTWKTRDLSEDSSSSSSSSSSDSNSSLSSHNRNGNTIKTATITELPNDPEQYEILEETQSPNYKPTDKTEIQLKDMNFNQEHRFILNIGGTKFEVTPSTCQADPSGLLAKMIQPDSPMKSYKTDNLIAYFIDRDSKHFRTILTYLRNLSNCPFSFTSLLPPSYIQ